MEREKFQEETMANDNSGDKRKQLYQEFEDAFFVEFIINGRSVLRRARETDPVAYNLLIEEHPELLEMII